MEAFIRVTPWSSFQSEPSESPKPSPAPARRGFGHFRSLSSITSTKPPSPSQSPSRQPQHHPQVARARAHGRSPSVSQLPDFKMPLSFSSSPSRSSPLSPADDDESDLSTLPDPRNKAVSPTSNHDGTASEADLGPPDELTTLSTKLIQAINHQSTLDNALSSARQDLDQARERIRQLEALTESQRELLAGDVWVRRKNMDAEKRAWAIKLADEKRLRGDVEKEKRKIELELENLTAALFEEANKMVVSVKEEAHKERSMMERKNEQLRSQVADTEALLRNQQEQLAELKLVMEQITAERDERMTSMTAPSSPGFVTKFDSREIPGSHRRVTSAGNSSLMLCSPTVAGEPLSPASPTTFAHLIQPVLRTDVTTYEDFKLLCRAGRTRAGSRTSSSSLSGINVGNLNLNSNSGQNGSGGGAHHSPSPSTSSLPNGLMSSPQQAAPPCSLKETKFYKRVLIEDIEPTLRLDAAPSISWLTRRSVVSAVTEGTLVVEPAPSEPLVPGAPSPLNYACSLCGESRKDGVNPRTHRFRTSESETASRYPLCGYCLGRVRSTCDFLGFLRIVKDGLWRNGAEGEEGDAERAAWEESVRLREAMFWARIGGGVVPVGQHLGDGSPRASCEKQPPTEAPTAEGEKPPADAADELPVKQADEPPAVDGAGDGAAAPESKPEVKRPALEINVQTPVDAVSEKSIPSPPGAFPAAMRAV